MKSRRTLAPNQKIEKFTVLRKNLNDADIISMPMVAICKVKMNYFVHEKSQIGICFLVTSSQLSSVRISHRSKNSDFRC